MGAEINTANLSCSYNPVSKNVTIVSNWTGTMYRTGGGCFDPNKWREVIWLGVPLTSDDCSAITCATFPNIWSVGSWVFGGGSWDSPHYKTSSGVSCTYTIVIGGAYFNDHYRGKNVRFYGRGYAADNPADKTTWEVEWSENCALEVPALPDPNCYCHGGYLSQPPLLFAGTLPPLAPSVPTFNLSNVYYTGIDSVEINITSNTTDVDYWTIQRSATSGGSYTTIGTVYPINGHIFYDTTVLTGHTYWYKVLAVNELYTTASVPQSIYVQTTVPTHCIAENEIHLGTITGNTSNATYALLRAATSGGVYSQVGVSTGLTLFDRTPVYGTTYWYKGEMVGNGWATTGQTPTQLATIITLSGTPVLTGSGTTVANLSWTDSNAYQQWYEVYHDQGAGYSLILTTMNQYATITGLTINLLHNFKIRSKIDCFDPTFIYSSYSNVVQVSVYPELNPATNGNVTSITCTGATLGWTNNNTGYTFGNRIKVLSGASFITIATVSSGTTSYVLTGLIPFHGYSYLVCPFNSGGTFCSGVIGFVTLDPAPFNLSASTSYNSSTINWQINDPPYGTAIRPEIRYSGTTGWSTRPTIAKNATTYTYTGLSWNTAYEARLVRIGTEYPSLPIGFTTADYEAPTNLIVTSIGDNQICLQWQNHGTISDNISVYVKESGYTWQVYQTVPSGTTSICVTGLSMQTEYTFVIANNYGVFELFSNQVQATTTVSFIPPFCANEAYTVTGATCGNADGWIVVDHDATIFYNFTLTDISGNSYTLTDFYWSGLTASWYQITCDVKPKWYYHYGSEHCVLDWIKVPDSNTTIILSDVKIRNAVCGGFGSGKGRIVYEFTDSNSGATSWTFSLYNERHQLVNVQHLTGITAIQYNSPSDIYYGILENNLGCVYLIDLTFVDAEKIFTVEGITDVYITPWTAGISYNYYSNSDDDWFVGSIDPLQFTSTKIKEFNGLTDFWYKINLVTATANYNESLQKSNNGLTYQETFTLTIPHADNQKWKELVNILTKRYIIVFKDAQGLYWTLGYRSGTEVRSYQLSTNQYAISFISPSVSKMLTNLDENYVKLQIL